MSYRQSNFNRRSGGGQGKTWQTSPVQQRRGNQRGAGGVGGFSDSLLSIPSLLSLEVGRQNRQQQQQQQQQQQERASYSNRLGDYANTGLLGNAPNDLPSFGNNRQSLLGPGPSSGTSYGSGLAGNYGVNRNRGYGGREYGDTGSSGIGMQAVGGRQNLGSMDEALAAKVRLQQAMLAAQALQTQSTMLSGNRFQSGGGAAMAGRAQDYDRRRDLSPRGGQQLGRRGQQQQFRNRDNRNQDRNRNQFAQQQQRNRDRNRQNLNKKNESRTRQQQQQQRQQQRKRDSTSKSKEQDKRDSKERKDESKDTKATKSDKDEAKSHSDVDDGGIDVADEKGENEGGETMETAEVATYDPSEPTEEDTVENTEGDESGRKRKRSENVETEDSQTLDDISVTIKKDSDGRAVSEPPRKKPAVAGEKEGDEKSVETDPKPNWFCHVCEARCTNLKNYENHMKGNRHRQKMDQIKELSEFQTKQAKARLQAERHIKNVLGENDKRSYCEDCKEYFRGSIIEHRKTSYHKNAKKDGRPHCRVCNVTFKTPKKFVAHCNTPGHKKVYEIARKNAEEEARKKGKEFNEDEEDFLPPNMEDFVTLDAVGFEDSDSDSDDDLNVSGSKTPSSAASAAAVATTSTTTADAANTDKQMKGSKTDNVEVKKTQDEPVSDSDPKGGRTTAPMKPSINVPLTAAPKAATPSIKAAASKDVHLDLDLGPYNPDIAVGQEHVVPVAGFFCKLCHKFYNNETNAKSSHCKSKGHYQAVKKYMNKQKEALSKTIEFDSASDVEMKSPKAVEKDSTTTTTTAATTTTTTTATAATPTTMEAETKSKSSLKKDNSVDESGKSEIQKEETGKMKEEKPETSKSDAADNKPKEDDSKQSKDDDTKGVERLDVEVESSDAKVESSDAKDEVKETPVCEMKPDETDVKETLEVKEESKEDNQQSEVKVESSPKKEDSEVKNDDNVIEDPDVQTLLDDIDDALGNKDTGEPKIEVLGDKTMSEPKAEEMAKTTAKEECKEEAMEVEEDAVKEETIEVNAGDKKVEEDVVKEESKEEEKDNIEDKDVSEKMETEEAPKDEEETTEVETPAVGGSTTTTPQRARRGRSARGRGRGRGKKR